MENNHEVKKGCLSLEQNERELLAQWERDKATLENKWHPSLEEISDKNQKIEEAWKDIAEHERRHQLAEDSIEDMSDDEREKFENEKYELEMARTLLKEEEERVSRHEKELLDTIEKEMDQMEQDKNGKLREIERKKSLLILDSDTELKSLVQRISEKESVLKNTHESIHNIGGELVECDTTLSTVVDATVCELGEIQRRDQELVTDMLDDVVVSETLTDISNRIIQVDNNYKKELKKIQSERDRYGNIYTKTMYY